MTRLLNPLGVLAATAFFAVLAAWGRREWNLTGGTRNA
jgi:hypothetical protein